MQPITRLTSRMSNIFRCLFRSILMFSLPLFLWPTYQRRASISFLTNLAFWLFAFLVRVPKKLSLLPRFALAPLHPPPSLSWQLQSLRLFCSVILPFFKTSSRPASLPSVGSSFPSYCCFFTFAVCLFFDTLSKGIYHFMATLWEVYGETVGPSGA